MCYIFKIHLAQRYSGRNVRKSDGTQFRNEHHQIKCRFIQRCWNSAKLLAIWFTAGCRVLLLWIFMLYVKKRCCPLLPNLPLIPQTTTSNLCWVQLLLSAPDYSDSTKCTIQASTLQNPLYPTSSTSSFFPMPLSGGQNWSFRGGEGAPDTFNPLIAQALHPPLGRTLVPGRTHLLSVPPYFSFASTHSNVHTYSSTILTMLMKLEAQVFNSPFSARPRKVHGRVISKACWGRV